MHTGQLIDSIPHDDSARRDSAAVALNRMVRLAPRPTREGDWGAGVVTAVNSRQDRRTEKEIQAPRAPGKAFRNAEQAAFEHWMTRFYPSGDCESVQAQWLKSHGRVSFLDEFVDGPGDAMVGHKQPTAQPTLQPVAASEWRKGSDVPLAERVGLWHVRGHHIAITVSLAWHAGHGISFAETYEYRPAPDGAQDGEVYNELRYWQANMGAQPVEDGMRVDIRDSSTLPGLTAVRAGDMLWKRIDLIAYWRLSREA